MLWCSSRFRRSRLPNAWWWCMMDGMLFHVVWSWWCDASCPLHLVVLSFLFFFFTPLLSSHRCGRICAASWFPFFLYQLWLYQWFIFSSTHFYFEIRWRFYLYSLPALPDLSVVPNATGLRRQPITKKAKDYVKCLAYYSKSAHWPCIQPHMNDTVALRF